MENTLYTYRINYESNTRKSFKDNSKWVSLVYEKAYNRRINQQNKVINIKPVNNSSISDAKNYGIVPHCMQSVVDLRRNKKFKEALRTGYSCLLVNATQLQFYKPLIYAISPISFINCYRRLKTITGKFGV